MGIKISPIGLMKLQTKLGDNIITLNLCGLTLKSSSQLYTPPTQAVVAGSLGVLFFTACPANNGSNCRKKQLHWLIIYSDIFMQAAFTILTHIRQ